MIKNLSIISKVLLVTSTLLVFILSTSCSKDKTNSHVRVESCTESKIKKVTSQLSSENKKTFSYTYKQVCNNAKTTIIYIPGGPGQGSIDSSQIKSLNVANVIYTDPRGVGRNFNYWKSDVDGTYLTTKNLALDIINVIKKENLSNYIIYGHSYGTVLATVLTHLIEARKDLNDPQSIVLEGTLGKALVVSEQRDAGNRLIKHFESTNEFCLHCKLQPYISKYSSSEVGHLGQTLLSAGVDAENIFKHLEESNKIKTTLKKNLESILAKGGLDLYNKVACNELDPTGFILDHYEDRKYIQVSGGSCENIDMKDPFNSRDFQVRAPIFYITGTHDISTPAKQALHHYQQQPFSQKTFICVQGGGHEAMSYNIQGCSRNILNSIVQDDHKSLKKSLTNCRLKTEIISPQECIKSAP